jgi:hypothetical protein
LLRPGGELEGHGASRGTHAQCVVEHVQQQLLESECVAVDGRLIEVRDLDGDLGA